MPAGEGGLSNTAAVAPVRFEHTKDDAARVFGGFRAFYWAIEIVWLVAAVFRREVISLAVGWPVVLLWWEWQVRQAPTGWVLEIDERAIVEVLGDERRAVERDATSFVRFRRRRMRYTAWTALQAIDPRGRVGFEVGIRDDHRDGIAAALCDRGWPVEV